MPRHLPKALAHRPVDDITVGVLYGLGAYGIWGLTPIYFKAVQHVHSVEVLAHRVVWAMVLLSGLLLITRRARQVMTQLATWRHVGFYLVTALLVGINWLVFIWAIHNNRLLEASLGYYINPLVSVLLGVLFLHERLNFWQLVAVSLAAIGVLNLVIGYGAFPWVALTLAFTFGFYGLLRKKAGVDAVLALSVETLLLTPVALLFLGALALTGGGALGRTNFATDVLLVFAGLPPYRSSVSCRRRGDFACLRLG